MNSKTAESKEELETLVDQAVKCERDGNYPQAIEYYSQAIQRGDT